MRNTLCLTALLAVLLLSTPSLDAATCTPTGFVRDGINLTAALINPTHTTGEVDATGCNIGVYFSAGFSGRVERADIHGANYFGVVVNGDDGAVSVDVRASRIHDIGESPLNGTQHGVAIYYRDFGAGVGPTGRIAGNLLWNYQKGGIVVNGTGTRVTVSDNIVKGQGPVGYIAQNGIQVGFGAHATVRRNFVSGHAYTGANGASSGGVLVVGGPGYGGDYTVGTLVADNILVNNDVGVYLSNVDDSFDAPADPTRIRVINNGIVDSAVTNTTGQSMSPAIGYQAGVSDVGNGDSIRGNDIGGKGYTTPSSATAVIYTIDTTAAIDAHVHGNRILAVHVSW